RARAPARSRDHLCRRLHQARPRAARAYRQGAEARRGAAVSWLTSTKTAPWLMTLGIVLLWQAVCSLFNVDEFIFPSSIQVWYALIEYGGPIRQHSLQTLLTTVAGFGIGVFF